MKLLCTADLHYRLPQLDWLVEQASKELPPFGDLSVTEKILPPQPNSPRFVAISPSEEINELAVDMALRTDSATFISLLMSSFDFDVTDDLDSLPVPLLIVGSGWVIRRQRLAEVPHR